MKSAILRRTSRLLAVGALLAMACEEEADIPVYQAVPVTVRDIVLSASAAGTIEPVQTVEVKSKASGEIIEVRVDVGDEVRRGDVLVRVDQRVPRNALMQAEADSAVAFAQLENAESQLRRAEALYQTESITEQEWENAKLARANAYASLIRSQRSLEDARIAFEDTEVRAASSGMILTRAVEVGTVIASASQNVSGGSVLLKMANLDTVQVRTLVDETDIGKIQPGLRVTITVDAYPNQPFEGRVLKIEPEALVEQNVTMFPVLIRIPNQNGLLRPGMNSEVEIHIGSARQVVAVPTAALRTRRDVESAASVLGLDMETVDAQLAAGPAEAERPQRATMGGATVEAGAAPAAEGDANSVQFMGRQVELPEGVTAAQVQEIMNRMRSGGGPQALSAADRAVLTRLRGNGGGFGGGRPRDNGNQFQFGGEYIVFVLRSGEPTALTIRTGITDLDYSEVQAGLTEADTVLILPSASLVQAQQEFQERMGRMAGGALGGTPPRGGRR